jgi:hypothetical protein
MKKLITLLALVLISTSIYAQTTSRATARIFEAQNKKLCRIVVVYEDGESEVIPLEAFKFMGVDADDILVANQKTINKMINDMGVKGYEIEAMTTTGETFFYSMIVFKKD